MCYSLWYNAPTMLPASGRQHDEIVRPINQEENLATPLTMKRN